MLREKPFYRDIWGIVAVSVPKLDKEFVPSISVKLCYKTLNRLRA